MLKTAFTVLQFPGRLTRTALKQATSPSAINTLSLAVAQGSIQVANADQELSIEGLEVDVEFNQQRLLTTAGVSTAIAFGSLYWLGQRLKIQTRYARMIDALEVLNIAIQEGSQQNVESALKTIDDISNPLLDADTLEPIDSPKEVKAIFEQVMKRPAEPGALFPSANLTSTVDDAVRTGSRASLLIAKEGVDEAIDAMKKKAVPLAGRAGVRAVGRLLWVDTVYWLGTSAIDVGLNYLGIPEEQQRIPFLADIPYIGGLFDFSNTLGASAVDLVLTPILDRVFSFFGLEEEAEELIDVLWGIILSASLSPGLAPFIIAILDFYIDDVDVSFDLDLLFGIGASNTDITVDLWQFYRPEPLDVLILWLYAIVAKIIFKAWVRPAYLAFTSKV